MQKKQFRFVIVLVGLLLAATAAQAQPLAGSGQTTLSVTVGPEAAILINTVTTGLTTATTVFDDFVGTTEFTYKIRTAKGPSSSGSITLQVGPDFTPTGGPNVANSGTTNNTLTYTCAVEQPGASNGGATACSETQTASTSTATNVVGFGANARSAKAGNTGSVAWALVNDPGYEVGTYTATVTFTISAT